jgi:hypothetical protein
VLCAPRENEQLKLRNEALEMARHVDSSPRQRAGSAGRPSLATMTVAITKLQALRRGAKVRKTIKQEKITQNLLVDAEEERLGAAAEESDASCNTPRSAKWLIGEASQHKRPQMALLSCFTTGGKTQSQLPTMTTDHLTNHENQGEHFEELKEHFEGSQVLPTSTTSRVLVLKQPAPYELTFDTSAHFTYCSLGVISWLWAVVIDRRTIQRFLYARGTK